MEFYMETVYNADKRLPKNEENLKKVDNPTNKDNLKNEDNL